MNQLRQYNSEITNPNQHGKELHIMINKLRI